MRMAALTVPRSHFHKHPVSQNRDPNQGTTGCILITMAASDPACRRRRDIYFRTQQRHPLRPGTGPKMKSHDSVQNRGKAESSRSCKASWFEKQLMKEKAGKSTRFSHRAGGGSATPKPRPRLTQLGRQILSVYVRRCIPPFVFMDVARNRESILRAGRPAGWIG